MFQNYIDMVDDILEDMEQKINSSAINHMGREALEFTHMEFRMGFIGRPPATATIDGMMQGLAIKDIHRASELDLMNLFINGFPGYKGFTLKEFLRSFMLTMGDITFMEPVSTDTSALQLATAYKLLQEREKEGKHE